MIEGHRVGHICRTLMSDRYGLVRLWLTGRQVKLSRSGRQAPEISDPIDRVAARVPGAGMNCSRSGRVEDGPSGQNHTFESDLGFQMRR